MKKLDNNSLKIENKTHTIKEFDSIFRDKFGGDNYILNVMLAETFLTKHPNYSCRISKQNNHISQKSCGCC